MKKLLLCAVLYLTAYQLQAQTSALYATGFTVSGGIAFDPSGNLFVANEAVATVSKVDAGGNVTATYAGFNYPIGLAFDAAGSLYVANSNANTVSKVDASGTITATYTGFSHPESVAVDAAGNLYVTNVFTNTVSKVDASGTIIATYAGFASPVGLALDASGNLYVANETANTVSKVDASGTVIATYTGFNFPVGLALDAGGNLYVANSGGHSISTVPAGSGDGTPATDFMSGLPYTTFMLAYHNNALYVSDASTNVYKITPQTRHYVALNATGADNGSSWANAYVNLQTAIGYAVGGDSIFVAKATYLPAVNGHFSMKDDVKIFGGFMGTETDFSQRSLANKATLQGNGNSVIANNSTVTAAAELDGFIVTGGNSTTAGSVATDYGGGMFNNRASPTIRNCIFSNNTSVYGGGICNMYASNPVITNCIFSGNITFASTGMGGGMANVFGASPTVVNCVFSGNNASGPGNVGGGMANGLNSLPIIVNCTFWNNTANYGGGAIFNYSSNVTITNCIIGGNTAGTAGQGILNSASTPVITYSDVQDGLAAGTGNIYADPLFTDMANGNYTLKSTSPCVNTGNSAANTTLTDLAGNPRVAGPAIDMGAYESPDASLPVALIGFTGKLQNGMAHLEWKTGAENSFDHFELQKGIDSKMFSTIATVPSKGDNSDYTVNTPQMEPTAYYRLKMVDNNGKSEYEQLIALSQTGAGKVAVYPNPASDHITVHVTGSGRIYIYNASGALVKSQILQAGSNLIDIRALNAGSYFVNINGTETRFIKR